MAIQSLHQFLKSVVRPVLTGEDDSQNRAALFGFLISAPLARPKILCLARKGGECGVVKPYAEHCDDLQHVRNKLILKRGFLVCHHEAADLA